MAGLGYNFKRILQQIAKILFVQIFCREIQAKFKELLLKTRNSTELIGRGFDGKWVLQG